MDEKPNIMLIYVIMLIKVIIKGVIRCSGIILLMSIVLYVISNIYMLKMELLYLISYTIIRDAQYAIVSIN